jgi:hypothetical protein
MRLVLRLIGTLLIAVAVVLAVIDGTKSLAAGTVVLTPLEASWMHFHPESLAAFKGFIASRLLGPLLENLVSAVLSSPGWAVIGIPGFLLAWAGRSRRERSYLQLDRF